ncbi:MAG: helix-turn-helix domain-containing protein [Ekhidna sp.]|nr:helix-turn-helix domain-containing protein [Ekhidna sp.]
MTNQKSIAVLPLENLSSDPENEYFSDGMTEEIINALSKIEGLKVTARTSSFVFKEVKKDVRHIGNELGVSLVLEGSVRKAGNNVRITIQLIRTDNGFHIWSENFDRKLEGIFSLQDEISLLVADRIRENFGHLEIKDHLIQEETRNVEAYEDYLRGKFHQLKWDNPGFAQAVNYYEKSIAGDPTYPIPYLAASQALIYLTSWNFISREEGQQKAITYLNKVSSAHSHLQEYQFSHLTRSLWLDWDWQAAYDHGSGLLKQHPSFTEGLEAMAELFYAVGLFDQGHDCIEKALARNPLSPNHHYTKGMLYYLSNDLERSIQSFDRSIELDTHWVLAIQLKACSLILLGKEEALHRLLSKMENTWEVENFQLLYDLMHKGATTSIIPNPTNEKGYLTWQVYLQVYSGDHENAIEKLRWGVENHIGQYIGFAHDPMLAPLREDVRFKKLVKETVGDIDFRSNPAIDKKVESTISQEEINHYSQELKTKMEVDKIFFDTSLTLRGMAETIDLHPNKLSWLLNEKIGKNFNDFINSYRLKAFQEKALDPQNGHLTLLGLAYESGFTSKSVFNDFFKKNTGLTPKAWVKQAKTS